MTNGILSLRLLAVAAAVLTSLGALAGARGGEPAAKAPPAKEAAAPVAKPITTAPGPLGDLLRKWYAEGTAAGNVGDYYDNRDRGHSDLDMSPYPQLQKIPYPEAARQRRLDWAGQWAIVPAVVFGNSSTSASPRQGGSNPRLFYTHPLGLRLLSLQYSLNNLYIYPAHFDYKPGRNGSPGFGDLYPTNTPYLIISLGSSGSDQPFMRAIPFAMAALRPEVKKRLIRSGLLMPTLQMIFRMTNKHLAGPQDYFTGKAHPSVFDGAWVDALKMVQMAHAITLDTIPPMAQLRVVEEDAAVRGRDFFEAEASEELVTTTTVVARVCRGRSYAHRMVVSAADSVDRNDRPLTYRWVVLRGDAARIRIKPLDPRGASAEIVVPWHDRRPIAEGSPVESNRVDIGLFVHNGAYYSAPAFVTFMFLDNEARTYDPGGRLLEIGYGVGETDIQVHNWPALFDLFQAKGDSAGAAMLKEAFSKKQIASFLAAGEEYRLRQADLEAAQKTRKQVEALKKPEADLKAARQVEQNAAKAIEDVLGKNRAGLRGAVKDVVLGALGKMARKPTLYQDNAKRLGDLLRDPARRAAFAGLCKRFVAWGLFKDVPGDSPVLQPIRGDCPNFRRENGTVPFGAEGATTAELTRFEKALVEQFHGELLGRLVFPGVVSFSYQANYVDPVLSAPKSWRDVYRYDAQGHVTGWTRYDGRRAADFNADGLVILERDAHGQPTKSQAVRYEQEKPKTEPGRRHVGPNWNLLRWVPAGG